MQQLTARIITGQRLVFIKRLARKQNEIASNNTETVFTSHISVLGPVISMKLLMSTSAQAAVIK